MWVPAHISTKLFILTRSGIENSPAPEEAHSTANHSDAPKSLTWAEFCLHGESSTFRSFGTINSLGYRLKVLAHTKISFYRLNFSYSVAWYNEELSAVVYHTAAFWVGTGPSICNGGPIRSHHLVIHSHLGSVQVQCNYLGAYFSECIAIIKQCLIEVFVNWSQSLVLEFSLPYAPGSHHLSGLKFLICEMGWHYLLSFY